MKGAGKNNRGIALLVTLLVTALLIALVFEFAYATRVSLRGAVNFRDSQRAYYLARSGVSFAGKLLAYNLQNGKLQDNLQRVGDECREPLQYVSADDMRLYVCWEDEAGKINIRNVTTGQTSLQRLEKLFGVKQIDLDALDRLKEQQTVRLVSELHKVMSDDEYQKIHTCGADQDQPCVTVYGSGTGNIDVNTASSEVLQSLGMSDSAARMIIEARMQDPFVDKTRLASSYGLDTTMLSALDVTSNTFLVRSTAVVGGYTKQAEAVITRSTGGYSVQYWRIL